MWNKLLSVLAFIAVLIVSSISGQIGKEVANTSFSAKPSQQEVEEKLIEGFTKVAYQLNQKLPIMLDEDTRVDKVTVGPGVRIVYHQTFPKYTSRDIDVNWLQSNLRPEVMRKICASADMKKSLQFGGVYVYSYSGNDGIEISEFEIDRNDCGLAIVLP